MQIIDFFFHGMSHAQILILIFSAILIGINKTGMPGLGLLPVVMLAIWFDSRISPGLQLVMLAITDIVAVIYYRHKANWPLLFRLIPSALFGIAVGWAILRYGIDRTPHASYVMNLTIGLIVIFLCIFSVVKDIVWKDKDTVPKHWAFAVVCGLFAGITTQLANAAGPIMAIYLLAMRFDKKEYMGTAAWYFMILNWIKLPIFWSEGRITKESFLADMGMIPFLFLGAFLGIVLLKKLPQKVFEKAVLFLSALAAIKLLIP
ncbi:MAG: sulfite exporter TauE/SafE family protein [Lentisphaeria bacterium]|nr:sulfite exporter TauE/SafE family protein [Lentisphaeria bacterium]